MAAVDQQDVHRRPPRMDVLARLTERVSLTGLAYLSGKLPDGRAVAVLPRSHTARDGATHHLVVGPMPTWSSDQCQRGTRHDRQDGLAARCTARGAAAAAGPARAPDSALQERLARYLGRHGGAAAHREGEGQEGRAEARIGAELKVAQERGEVATQERKASTVPAGNGAPASHAEIGLTRKQAMEAKRLASAGEPAIREEVKQATSEGRRPAGRVTRGRASPYCAPGLRRRRRRSASAPSARPRCALRLRPWRGR